VKFYLQVYQNKDVANDKKYLRSVRNDNAFISIVF